jgi:hypothetical protein
MGPLTSTQGALMVFLLFQLLGRKWTWRLIAAGLLFGLVAGCLHS